MEAGKRRRLGEQGWREVLRRFDVEGSTVGEFCRRQGVSQSSLHRWRARLAAASSGSAADPCKQQRAVQTVAAGGFVDLGALAASDVNTGARLDLKLDLGAGLTLHLVRG